MATEIQQIFETVPRDVILFGSWLSNHGLESHRRLRIVQWLNNR